MHRRHPFVSYLPKKWLLTAVVVILQFCIAGILLLQIVINNKIGTAEPSWDHAPHLSMFVRLYHGSVAEYWQIFAPSLLLFWPAQKWRNSDLVLVFDNESTLDHQTATVMSLLPPYPKVHFEDPPPPGTTCLQWRSEGYARQIYSTFYADRYTQAPFIGITDSDAFFAAKVLVEDLFEPGTKKPRILGYNGCCTGWEVAAASVVPGKTRIGEFMTVIGFPFVIHRHHLAQFRQHAMAVYNATSFEDFFRRMCQTHPEYSQFNMLAYYLFHHHRADYSWHIRDNEQARHPLMRRGRLTFDPDVLGVASPKIGVMKHAGHRDHAHFPLIIYDYVCSEANFSSQVGSCSQETDQHADIRHAVRYNLVTDLLVKNALWDERAMPQNSAMVPWPALEKMPNNTDNLFSNRTSLVLEKYKNAWHW